MIDRTEEARIDAKQSIFILTSVLRGVDDALPDMRTRLWGFWEWGMGVGLLEEAQRGRYGFGHMVI